MYELELDVVPDLYLRLDMSSDEEEEEEEEDAFVPHKQQPQHQTAKRMRYVRFLCIYMVYLLINACFLGR